MADARRSGAWLLLPNAVTATGFLLALASMMQATAGEHERAAWTIVWCGLLDRVDGAVARLTRTSSELGVQFDTLTDLVAFCVAPTILAYHVLQHDAWFSAGWGRTLLLLILASYCLAGAIRLARYNTTAASLGAGWFQGLPTTFAGLLSSLYLLVCWDHGIPGAVSYAPLLMALLALLMLATLWLPKSLGLAKDLRHGRLVRITVIFLVGTGYVLGILRMAPAMLGLVASLYVIVGFPVGWWLRRSASIEGTPASMR